jgi:Secretion system C-terminal sorting domain
MLRVFLCFVVFTNIVSITIAQNLISNPGCEDSLINGEIPHWIEVRGTDWQNRESGNPPSYEGNNMFFAGVSQTAELQQDIDVSAFTASIDSGTQHFYFEGYVRSFSQNPPDHSGLFLKYLDLPKITLLDSIDLGENSNTDDWLRLSDATLAPIGTRFIRICLISVRYNGTNNDGYFDGLSLTPDLPVNIENVFQTSITDFTLSQNYPNPFNPSTTISWQSPISSWQTIKLFDLLGREIETIIEGYFDAGSHSTLYIVNSSLQSGVYFYQLRAGSFIQTKKMLLLK